MLFALSIFTVIVTLLWSLQFIAPIQSLTTIVWLNMIMIITWITLCTVNVRRWYLLQNQRTKLIPSEMELNQRTKLIPSETELISSRF